MKYITIFLAILAFIYGELAYADMAEDMLGVNNIHPIVRKILDEDYDEDNHVKKLIGKVRSGELPPGKAGAAILSTSKADILEYLKKQGFDVDGDEITTAMKFLAQAQLELLRPSKETSLKLKHVNAPPEQKMVSAASVNAPKDSLHLKELQIEASQYSKHVTAPKIHVPSRSISQKDSKINTPAIAADVLEHSAVNAKVPKIRLPETSLLVTEPKISFNTKNLLNSPVDVNIARNQIEDKLDNIKTKRLDYGVGGKDFSRKLDRAGLRVERAIDKHNIDRSVQHNIGDSVRGIDSYDLTKKIEGNIDQGVNQNGIESGIYAGIDGVGNTKIKDPSVKNNQSIGQINKTVDNQVANVGKIGVGNFKVPTIPPFAQPKSFDASVNVDKIREAANPGLSKDIGSNIAVGLDQVSKKVTEATQEAFSNINGVIDKKVAEKQSLYNTAKTNYDNVYVHPIVEQRICSKHIGPGCCRICVSHTHVPTQSSVTANSKDLAIKAIAKGKMDAADKKLKAYQQAKAGVVVKERSTMTNIAHVFAAAKTNVSIGAHLGKTDTSTSLAGADDTVGATTGPKFHASTTPLNVNDSKVIVIRGNVNETLDQSGAITAAIGANATAITEIADIGTAENTNIGPVDQTIDTPGTVTAAIGYRSGSVVKVGNIDGTIQGSIKRKITSPGIISAAIGYDSEAIIEVGNLMGTIHGAVNQTIKQKSVLAASIGGDTSSKIKVGSISRTGEARSFTQNITNNGTLVSAAIGYDSDTDIIIGHLNAKILGDFKQTIITGGVNSVSIGADTSSRVRIGAVNAPVHGNLTQNISTGQILDVALGVNTHTKTEIGVIDAPVHGNVNMNINTGNITTATVGIGTRAETMIGSVYAPVTGNLDTDINVGDVTSFSIGIGIGGDSDIHAITQIGSVFEPVTNPGKILVHAGNIYTLGFGLVLDLGAFGTLPIRHQGCSGSRTRLGNVGEFSC